MDMTASLTLGLAPETLSPGAFWLRAPGRAMVERRWPHAEVPRAGEGLEQHFHGVERDDRHLEIDDVFGGQPRHGCRPNVVNAHGKVPQASTQLRRQLAKLGRPTVLVGNDLDPAGGRVASVHATDSKRGP